MCSIRLKAHWLLFSISNHTRHYGHAALVMTALNTLLDYHQDLIVDASPMLEVSRQIGRENDFEWYGLLNHSGQLGNGFFQPLSIHDTELSFKAQKKVNSVKSLSGNTSLDFHLKEGGWVNVVLPELGSYDVLLVEYE